MASRARRTADDDRSLLEGAGEPGDVFTELYRRHSARIYGYAYRRSGSREVAEEVTATTFERAWRALPRFEWRGGGFEPWLFRIASSEVAGWYRREQLAARPSTQAALRAAATDTPATVEDLATLPDDDLRAALATLRPRHQEVLTLRYLAGLTTEETAAALGCSRATLAVATHRAVAALRHALATTTGGDADGGDR